MTPHIYSTIPSKIVVVLLWDGMCLLTLYLDDSHFCNLTHNRMDFLFKLRKLSWEENGNGEH